MDELEADRLIHTDDPVLVEQGLAYLRARAQAEPDDAVRWFVYGGALDFNDRPQEAMVAYGRVGDIGVEDLPPADQPRFYVQAGSTLRNLGRLQEARALLQQGRQRFPGFQAIGVFLVLVDVSAGRDRHAIGQLLDIVLEDRGADDSIRHYYRALTWYADQIRQDQTVDDTARQGSPSS